MADQPKPFVSLSLVKQAFPDAERLAALAKFDPARDEVPFADLEDSLRVINRRFDRFPLKGRALYLLSNNRIHLLGNKETVEVGSFLPGWRVAGPRGVAAFVNAVPYVSAAGAAHMDVRKLFGLVLVGQALVDTWDSWGKVSGSSGLAKAGAAVYSRMMFKTIDRICGTGADRMRSDQLKYVLAKYFLFHLMEMPPTDGTEQIAADIAKGSGAAALRGFEAALVAAPPEPGLEGLGDAAFLPGGGEPPTAADDDTQAVYRLGLIDFLKAISKADQWLARLTARGFLQAFVSMYNPPALLAAEDLGFFLAALATHQCGAELVSSFAFDPVYGTEGPDVLVEFSRLCG